MSWYLGRLAGFDIESTGVSPERDRIVTACVVQCGGTEAVASATWMADPGLDIPEAAAAVHGITTERARAEGRPAGEVVEQVVTALTAVVLSGIPVVAMNAAYDLTMLDREARRHGVQPLAETVGDDLHAQQTVWAREQAESLADYFRRTPGKEDRAKFVRGDWPLIPHQRSESL
ncbi:exonuclease domain-containing protein [Streptomyces sp. NPDC059696]|uniref:exonuclease domain-containing protein n=1 Tax=Streptomyces sp. NPDC059696 TaxID=3346911 RepID=UPI0036C6BAAE